VKLNKHNADDIKNKFQKIKLFMFNSFK